MVMERRRREARSSFDSEVTERRRRRPGVVSIRRCGRNDRIIRVLRGLE